MAKLPDKAADKLRFKKFDFDSLCVDKESFPEENLSVFFFAAKSQTVCHFG